jgi:hypothetical protein
MRDYPILVLLAVSVLVVFINYWPRISAALRSRGTSAWPLFPATVEESLVHTYSGKSSTTYTAELIYSYQVDGEYYSGRYEGGFLSEGEAQAMTEKYPKGTLLQIRAHPERPERSVWDR